MAKSLRDRLIHSWNAFKEREEPIAYPFAYGPSYSYKPDRTRLNLGNERSIIASVLTRIGIDVSAIPLQHVRLDQNGRFVEVMQTSLNNCLQVEANIDQTGRAFMQDVVMSLCDEGAVAIVPVDTTINPRISGSYDIQSMRVAKILEWYPQHVRLYLYNDKTGQKEEITLPKRTVAIVENPLYAVMNEPNSTLKRLVNKLNLLDAIDQQSGSGKLDLIIQLPYVIKTPARREQAEIRRKDIEDQLAGSKYGVAYTDGTERITQLNRPAENNLMAQIEYLTSMLYGQLGLVEGVFDGTADETTMINYYNRTIEPLLGAVSGAMLRSFLTKTARTQGQSIAYFRNPFGLLPAEQLGTLADSFTRNEILTSNEFRAIIGYKPSSEAGADELRNKNLNEPTAKPEEEKPEIPKLESGNEEGSDN